MVELAMILAILGIVAAVAIPSITSWRESFALRNASQEVFATLMQAKTEAMRRNRVVNFNIDTANPARPKIQICFRDCTAPANFKIKQSLLTDGVRLASGNALDCQAPLVNNSISFNAKSLPQGGLCGSIYLAIGQRQARVEIGRTGIISIH